MKRDAGASTYYALIILMYLFENTDSEKRLTLRAIKEGIENDPRHNLSPSIDTVNKVVRHLKDYGFDIKPLKRNNKKPGSYLDTRYFDEWEIKLFADAVLNNAELDFSTSEKLITKLLKYLGPTFLAQKENYYQFFKYREKTAATSASLNLAAIQKAIRLKKKITYNLPSQKEHERVFNKTKASVYEVLTIKENMYILLSEKNTNDEYEFKLVALNEITNVELFPENVTPPVIIKNFSNYENEIRLIMNNPLKYRKALTNYYIFTFSNIRERSFLARTYGDNFIFEEENGKFYGHFFSKRKLKVSDLFAAASLNIKLIYPESLALELQQTITKMADSYSKLDLKNITLPNLKITQKETETNA